MRRKFLSELNEASPILMEMGYWDIILCAWAVFAVFSILAISMARSKNVGKGKAHSPSMERAVKKRKSDTSQTIKKGKGKRRDSASESEEASENEDEKIEACLPSLLIQNEKNGPNRLQSEIFIASGL